MGAACDDGYKQVSSLFYHEDAAGQKFVPKGEFFTSPLTVKRVFGSIFDPLFRPLESKKPKSPLDRGRVGAGGAGA
jgi:hypothetical protein